LWIKKGGEEKNMKDLVKELGQLVPFKETTDIGDLVLIVAKEPHMLLYALVTDITRDATRKAEWWHLALTFLTIPPQETIWILRTPQMTGMEIFTMGGEERFLKAVNITPSLAKPEGVPSSRELEKPAAKKTPFLKRVK
jgi:hypothetical protein